MTPPEHLGKYHIIEQIGQGAYGTVYKARDTRLHRIVALKVLDPVLTRDPLFVRNLATEARVTANLQHDHIVRVHDVDEDQGLHFIAMEYVPGGTLAQLLEPQRPLPLKTACTIVRQVAAALDHAHAQELVHRDVKPSNVLLETDPEKGGRAKLSDFGLARAAMTSSVHTSAATTGGFGVWCRLRRPAPRCRRPHQPPLTGPGCSWAAGDAWCCSCS